MASHEIAEPLVGQFVRHEGFAGLYILGGLGEEGGISQGCGAGVFHAALHEVIDADLIILCPRRRNPGFEFEKRHHVLRILER